MRRTRWEWSSLSAALEFAVAAHLPIIVMMHEGDAARGHWRALVPSCHMGVAARALPRDAREACMGGAALERAAAAVARARATHAIDGVYAP